MKKPFAYWGYHVIGWLGFFSLPVSFAFNWGPPAIGPLLGFIAFYLVSFYVHTDVLLPRLFARRHYLGYALLVGLLLALSIYLQPFDNLARPGGPPPGGITGNGLPLSGGALPPISSQGNPGAPPGTSPGPVSNAPPGASVPFDILSLVLQLICLGIGFGLQWLRQWQRLQVQHNEAVAARAMAELAAIKNQVNTHFLFNNLHALYSMLQTGGTQQAAEGILKLSEVMRYLTDGSQKQMISLEEEVSFLQSFIDWQRLRLGDEWNIHFSFKEEGGPYVLPPLLLLTIVENAFKHGVQTTLPAAITIQLTASPNVLILATQNNLPELPDNRTGHSVQNLLKRLEWLYGKNYSLVTNAQDGKYLATLTIPWKANQF